MGRSDLKEDPRFLTRATRVANFDAVDELIETWTTSHTKDQVAKRMLAAAVPSAPVRDLKEVMHDENMHARGQFTMGRPSRSRPCRTPAFSSRLRRLRPAPDRAESSVGRRQRRRVRRLVGSFKGRAGYAQSQGRRRLIALQSALAGAAQISSIRARALKIRRVCPRRLQS